MSTDDALVATPPGGFEADPKSTDQAWRGLSTSGAHLLVPRAGRGDMPCWRCFCARLASNGWPEPVPVGDGAPTPPPGLVAVAGAPGRFLAWDTAKSWSVHRCLALPGCGCVPAAAPPSEVDFAAALSALVGPVRRLHTWQDAVFAGDALGSHMAVADVADLRVLGSPGGELTGVASGTPESAAHAAIAEALERYSASFMPVDLPVCRARDLGEASLRPSPAAFGGEPLGTDSRLRWARGERLADGSGCWIAAASVYFPYVCHDDEPRRSVGSSEGLAAGATAAQAIEHGTLELIERDAFMRAWRWGAPRWRLDPPYPRRPDLHFVRIGNRFNVPVVAAFSESDDLPYCAAGLAARLTLAEAVEAAGREATCARAVFRRVRRDRRLEARYAHAVDPQWRAARRRFAEAPAGPGPACDTTWARLVERLPDAAAVNATSADVAALGLHVYRVVMPETHGFEPTPDHQRMGGHAAPIPY